MGSYRELEVWKRALSLAVLIYQITGRFPPGECFVLTSQLRRAACSIPANIAEGSGRGSDRDFCRYLGIAYGSLLETETLMVLSFELGMSSATQCEEVLDQAASLGRMLNGMKAALKSP